MDLTHVFLVATGVTAGIGFWIGVVLFIVSKLVLNSAERKINNIIDRTMKKVLE